MPVSIKQTRGDINLIDQDKLKEGQLFWSFINDNSTKTLDGHTYSRGQLWIKDKSGLVEVADRRALEAFAFAGYIDSDFDGDFINAHPVSQAAYRFCRPGDAFIFKCVDKQHYSIDGKHVNFYPSDILVITKAVYEDNPNEIKLYRKILKEVEYIKISGAGFDTEDSDLDADNIDDAIKELELRLRYVGELETYNSFIECPRKKGWLYLLKDDMSFDSTIFELTGNYEGRVKDGIVNAIYGDMIFWNGLKWVLIPSGLTPKTIKYVPDSEEINGIATFEDYHKQLLLSAKNIQEALDILNKHKAPLNKHGKIPYSVLPTSVTTGLRYQGKFYPIIDPKGSKVDPKNQNNWPVPVDLDGDELSVWQSGWFYIVDCSNITNVQYVDKDHPGRTIELNTGDWVVWNQSTGMFEVIDNSDRISAIDVYVSNTDEKVTILGNVGFRTTGDYLKTTVSENTILLDLSGRFIEQGDTEGTEDYYPKYDKDGKLIDSHTYEKNGTIVTDWSFQVGKESNTKELTSYGGVTVLPTIGNTPTGWLNHSYHIENIFNTANNELFRRHTNLVPSEKTNFTKGLSDLIKVIMPEANSTLLAMLESDKMFSSYLPKVNAEGFLTGTLIREKNNEVNVGSGRTVSENMDTSIITFFASSDQETGFYTRGAKDYDPLSSETDLLEHLLKREDAASTSLQIHPDNIAGHIQTLVYMPRESGTLTTWEEFQERFGTGEPLMIPTWELHTKYGMDFIGLSSSPMRIRLNRKASGNEKFDRENDLSKDYGEGLKSAWSYKGSNHEESIQEEAKGSIDDVVSFDAWVEARRSIATKEAFVLPSTTYADDDSTYDNNKDNTDKGVEVKGILRKMSEKYGPEGKGGAYTRILPSRTVFADDAAYYDEYGKLKPQEVAKDIELPAESGVLATHNSILRAGFYTK